MSGHNHNEGQDVDIVTTRRKFLWLVTIVGGGGLKKFSLTPNFLKCAPDSPDFADDLVEFDVATIKTILHAKFKFMRLNVVNF